MQSFKACIGGLLAICCGIKPCPRTGFSYACQISFLPYTGSTQGSQSVTRYVSEGSKVLVLKPLLLVKDLDASTDYILAPNHSEVEYLELPSASAVCAQIAHTLIQLTRGTLHIVRQPGRPWKLHKGWPGMQAYEARLWPQQLPLHRSRQLLPDVASQGLKPTRRLPLLLG